MYMVTQSCEGVSADAPTALRLYARAVARLCDCADGSLVGYIYEWNTGEQQPAWFSEPLDEFMVEPLVAAA